MTIDLEEYIPPFILETKKINVPESPYAFNSSIIRWQNRLFMSFREISNPLPTIHSAGNSYLFIVELDKNFETIGTPQRIPFQDGEVPSRVEDARLISFENELYLIYSNNVEEELNDGGFRVYVAKLTYDGSSFAIKTTERLSNFEGESPLKREKNWVPFIHEDNLLLTYSLVPHKILLPLLNQSGTCETLSSTKPSIVWEWGELRGGTPAILIDDTHYLSFFHSSKLMSTNHSDEAPSLHYFVGAYLFDASPPFEIKKVSPEPIVGKDFYHGLRYEPYWKPVQVIFPCGILEDDEFFWITYGRQDHETWIAKLDKKELLESLIRVTTIP